MNAGGSTTIASKRRRSATQRLERLEAVAFQQLDVEAVGVGRRRRRRERRRGGIDAGRLRRARAQRLQAETARVAEDVEHPGTPGVTREQRAIRRLVEVPARLLARRRAARGSPRRPPARRPWPARRRRRRPRGARVPRVRAWASRSSTGARAAPRPWRAPPGRRTSSPPCRPCSAGRRSRRRSGRRPGPAGSRPRRRRGGRTARRTRAGAAREPPSADARAATCRAGTPDRGPSSRALMSVRGFTYAWPRKRSPLERTATCAPGAKAVRGVAVVSISFENTHRCPAWRRRSSRGFSTSRGNALAAGTAGSGRLDMRDHSAVAIVNAILPDRGHRHARPASRRAAQSACGRNEPLPAAARGEPGGLVPVGRGSPLRLRGSSTARSWSRSATPPATGAT